MIYMIISLLFIMLALTGLMLRTLEDSKGKKQPSYVLTESNEEVLERLRNINQ